MDYYAMKMENFRFSMGLTINRLWEGCVTSHLTRFNACSTGEKRVQKASDPKIAAVAA